jgi:predicted kinase
MPTQLILIRGLPGSGKSTLAKLLPAFHHIEADRYFTEADGTYRFNATQLGEAHAWCQDLANGSLLYRRDTVVSNTFTTLKEMQPYLDMAKKYGAQVTVIKCEGNYGSLHGVPQEVIDKMKARWENYL